MPDRDLAASHLQRETERQNRIYQDAIARKKNQTRAEDARIEPQFAQPVGGKIAANRFAPPQRDEPSSDGADARPAADAFPSHAGPSEPSVTAEDPAQAWSQKLRRIPDIRSALIPMPDQADAGIWSKPFSLVKADMEPWLSFYKGYTQSRLFLDGASALAGEERRVPSVDFAVRALLDLKQVDVKAILEPPVQINGPVEYVEMEEDLRACRSEAEARGLMKSASDVHHTQLRKAVEKGREMGALLYDALMGDGHVNLIKAWEGVHGRRPTVEELHLMLTTGRTKLAQPKRVQAEVMPEAPAERIQAAAMAAFGPAVQPSAAPPLAKEAPPAAPGRTAGAPVATRAAKGRVSWVEKRLERLSPQRRILVPVILAAGACAALVGLGLAGVI